MTQEGLSSGLNPVIIRLRFFYDSLSGELDVGILGNLSNMELSNLSQSIKDSISTEKVMNEVHLEESVMEREEECEWDMKWALDHSPLYR